MQQPRPPTRAEFAALREIGRRVGDIRRKRGMTQIELAAAVGVSAPRIRKIETQIFNLTSLVLLRLARALKVDASELLAQPKKTPRRSKQINPNAKRARLARNGVQR